MFEPIDRSRQSLEYREKVNCQRDEEDLLCLMKWKVPLRKMMSYSV